MFYLMGLLGKLAPTDSVDGRLSRGQTVISCHRKAGTFGARKHGARHGPSDKTSAPHLGARHLARPGAGQAEPAAISYDEHKYERKVVE